VPIVGPPGSLAMVTVAGAESGWNSTVPGCAFDNAYAALVARRAPLGVARHYDSDHFAIYHPPLVPCVLADQTAFLQEHLGVHA
jgi:hypothetical protein